MPADFQFRLLATDGAARRGELATPHGVVATPAFMPVGTVSAWFLVSDMVISFQAPGLRWLRLPRLSGNS